MDKELVNINRIPPPEGKIYFIEPIFKDNDVIKFNPLYPTLIKYKMQQIRSKGIVCETSL